MPNLRLFWLASFFSLFLVACGGGGTIGNGDGDSDDVETGEFKLTLSLEDGSGNPLGVTTTEQPIVAIARLTRNGKAHTGKIISFSTEFAGELAPSSGNVITDADGVASITILPGDTNGAGALTAAYQIMGQTDVLDTVANFTAVVGGLNASVELTTALTDVNGVVIREISEAQPGVISILLTENGQPKAFEIVTVSTDYGVLQSETGLLLTNASGMASVSIEAGSDKSAGVITASYGADESQVTRTINFQTKGDQSVVTNSTFSLDVSLISANDEVSEVNYISAAQSGLLIARLIDENNDPVVNKVVNFSSTLGDIFPGVGTALTDTLGFAKVQISAGNVKGAGVATASYDEAVATVAFTTEGDVSVVEETVDIAVQILDCNDGGDPLQNTCTPDTNISLTRPGSILVTVTRQNSTDAIANLLVSASTDTGSLSPSNGRVLTDENGQAVLTILAGEDQGAGIITLTANSTTETATFEIGSAQISMGNGTGNDFVEGQINTGLSDGEELAVGSTAVLTVNIVDESSNNAPYSEPLTVQFTSSCASEEPPKAVIDTEVTAVNGVATAIYRADGCTGKDLINATASAGSIALNATASIDIATASASSIQFDSIVINGDSDGRIITYPGTGDTSQAEVTFTVTDENNNAAAGIDVCFELSTDVGGITVSPDTAVEAATTLTDGSVKAIVTGGTVPTPVRVIASLAKNDGSCADDSGEGTLRIRAVSDTLTVSTGLPDQNSFTLGPVDFNHESWDTNGIDNTFTVRLADHFNNPVPNGTAVSFVAEGGNIDPACVTDDGACSVTWTSSSPRPGDGSTGVAGTSLATGECHNDLNHDGLIDAGETFATNGTPCVLNGTPYPLAQPRAGRVTVLAYAVGEESFIDANGDGFYNDGEAYGDLDEAFLDHNVDGYFCGRLANDDPASGAEPDSSGNCQEGGDGEEFIDFNSNNTFDRRDGIFSGILCKEEDEANGICTRKLVHVNKSVDMVMSGSTAYVYFYDSTNNSELTGDDVIDLTTASGSALVSFIVYITDENNNPMPNNTTVSVATDNGEMAGATDYEFNNTNSATPIGFTFQVQREKEPNETPTGLLTLTVTTPAGSITSYSISVSDDG